jgi:nucleoside-diphosphate-sugar epimerase
MEVDLTPGARLAVVTGAGGFIGRAVCAQLQARGWRVRGLVRTLDRHTAARADFLPVGDLATLPDTALVHAVRGARAVVHLAARVHLAETASTASLAAYRRVNVEVTQRVARAAAAAGVAHFVFASSIKVNGEMTLVGRPFIESDPPDPHDDYAASKWEAERGLGAVAADTGLRVTALRLPLTYGSGARANFARLARVVRRGVPLPFAGIDNRRSLLGIENLVGALAAVLADDGADEGGRITPYLLADAEAVSTPGLVRELAVALNVEPRLFAVPTGLLRFAGVLTGHSAAVARLTTSLEVDIRAFRTRFGWSPPCTLAQGLAAACADHAPAREPTRAGNL